MAGKMCALIRQTWYESARDHLTDLERLTFYEACFNFEFAGEIPTANTCKYSSVLLLFDMVKEDLRKDREKAENIAARARENGQYGGRPRRNNKELQEEETQPVSVGYEKNPGGCSSSSLHYNSLHSTTIAASSLGSGSDFNGDFFDKNIWPKLNKSGKYNTRHRVCVAQWMTYSERKRAAIVKTVLSDMFAGCENPYYYLEDFAEPEPHYLSGREQEQEWQSGKSVAIVETEGGYKSVTLEEAEEYGLKVVRIAKPA